MTLEKFITLVDLRYDEKIRVFDYWKTNNDKSCVEYGSIDKIHGIDLSLTNLLNNNIHFFCSSPSNSKDEYWVYID